MVVNRISKMGARGGGGGGRGGGGSLRSVLGSKFAADRFTERIGTTGTIQTNSLNGSFDFYGNKTYGVYVNGNKGGGTFSFKTAGEANAFIGKMSKVKGFSVDANWNSYPS